MVPTGMTSRYTRSTTARVPDEQVVDVVEFETDPALRGEATITLRWMVWNTMRR
jgi:hypothetical protein